MRLTLAVPGATAESLQLGLEAARAVFATRGVDPTQADVGRWRRQLWGLKGIELSEDVFDPQDAIWAEVWHQAEVAALGAALPHWRPGQPWPAGACLTLHREAKVATARELPLGAIPFAASALHC